MYKNKKILSLIPSRGGSKGLADKNCLELAGKPLIAWSIEHAKNCSLLDKVLVSTDSDKIMDISKSYGAEAPFKRPADLASDTAKTIDVALHALDYFEERGESFDYLALLEPTSPLRKKTDTDNAIKKLINNEKGSESLVSLGEISLEHPDIVKIIDKESGFLKPYIVKEENVSRRQDLNTAYFPYGVMYLSSIKSLRSTLNFYQADSIPYLIERWQNYEIDDIYDFKCIETIIELKREEI